MEGHTANPRRSVLKILPWRLFPRGAVRTLGSGADRHILRHRRSLAVRLVPQFLRVRAEKRPEDLCRLSEPWR